MWEALELGAQAEKPQLSDPGGGAVIRVRAAVNPVSPPRRVRPCDQEAARLKVRGQPDGAGTDRNSSEPLPCGSGIVSTGVLSS